MRIVRTLAVFLASSLLGSFAGASVPRVRLMHPVKLPPTAVPPLDSPPAIDSSLIPDPDPYPRLNPTCDRDRAWLLAEGPAPVPGDGRRYVTLTFDDGPFPETTPVVLDLLARHHVTANFFFIGKYLVGDSARAIASRATARAVAEAGHVIGSHTEHHALLTVMDDDAMHAEIDTGLDAVQRATGLRPHFFRPPYGRLDSRGEDALCARHLELVLWSVEAEDMEQDDVGAMVDRLETEIDFNGGGTVLLHDVRWSSVHVLERLLTWLDQHAWNPARPADVGYVMVDLPDYLRVTSSHPQPYADRKDLEDARAAAWRAEHPRAAAPKPAAQEAAQ